MAYELAIDGILYIEIKEKTSTSVTFRIYTEGINEMYVGNCALFLYSSDENGNINEYIKHEEFYLTHDQIDTTVTFDSLSSSTKYWVRFTDYPDSEYYNEWFDFATPSNTTEEDKNGFSITKEITSSSAYITVVSSNGDGNEYYYDLYLVNPEIDEEHIPIDDGRIIWDVGENMPIIYQFDNLISGATYWLETGIPDLGRIEFTTMPISISIDVQEVTSSSIKVRASESPSDNYDYWTWCIRKVGEDTIIEQDGNSSGARTKTFLNLESNTDYYIWLKLERFSPEKFDVIGIYVTTLPIEGIFSWTYAGKKKNDNGTYELVLGDTKGADGAEYFYLTADEWNELTDSINVARNKKGDLPIDFIVAVPDADFTWTMYNEVLKNIYDLTNETAPSDKHAVKGGSVTAEKLNHLKDKLNEYLES